MLTQKSSPVIFLLFIGLTLVLSGTDAHALTTLKGDEAKSFIGDIKTHVMAGRYTYEILSRSHRDAMHGRFSDALIFNPEGGNFRYPRRKNGDHILVIDDPSGREEEPVTEDDWRRKIGNTLSDDNNIPYVFLDDSRRELAILYVGKGTEVTSKMNAQNLLEITIKVDGGQGGRSSRRRGYM